MTTTTNSKVVLTTSEFIGSKDYSKFSVNTERDEDCENERVTNKSKVLNGLIENVNMSSLILENPKLPPSLNNDLPNRFNNCVP